MTRFVRHIAARVGRSGEAEDLASQVFVRAVEALDSYEERGLPMQAWLFRIAHNLVVDFLRRGAHRQTVPVDELLVAGAGHYPLVEYPEIVNPAIVAFARQVYAVA
mgnify:CR=1 FL=1